MRVRPAKSEDISAMMAIEKHAVTAAHWSQRQYQEALIDSSVRRLTLVIEDQTVQGFLIARAIAQEWEIENIAIAGPARRRGLGTRLLGEFIDKVRTDSGIAVFLETRESNHAARGLYEKWAFVESGRRTGYYRDPEEDAVLYRLSC